MTKFRTTCHCVYYWGTWGLHIETKHFWRCTDKVKSVRHTHGQVSHCGSQGEVWTNRENKATALLRPTLLAVYFAKPLTLRAEWILVWMKVRKKWPKKIPRLDTVLCVSSVRWYQYKTAFYTVLHVQICCATAAIRHRSTELAKHQHFVQSACLMIKSKHLPNVLISDLMALCQACHCCDFHGFDFCSQAALRQHHCDESCESRRRPEQTKRVLQDFYERLRTLDCSNRFTSSKPGPFQPVQSVFWTATGICMLTR